MPHAKNYRLLISVAFLQGIVFYGPAATIYRRAYGLDIQGLFIVESISWVAVLLLEVPWGRFADRFGYRKTLLIGNFVFLVSKGIFSVATGFAGFLAERLALSVALAALSGCSEALVHRSVGVGKAAAAFGRWHAAGVAGLMVASACWPLLGAFPLRVSAYATMVPYALALACSVFLADVEEPDSGAASGAESSPRPGRYATGKPGTGAALRALGRNPGLIVFLVVSAMVNEASQVSTVFLAPLQYERAGIPMSWFGALFALVQGAGMAAAGSGPLARLLGRERSFRALLLAAGLSLAALAVTDSAALSIAALVTMSVASSLFRPLSAARQNEGVVGPERATALSMYAMLMETVAAAVNVGVGRIASSGLGGAFGALGVALACSCLAPGRVFAEGRAAGRSVSGE